MPNSLLELLPYLGVAALAGAVGGALPTVWPPGERLRGYIQHFAGGVLLAVVAAEVLPEIRELDRLGAMIAGLVLGALLMVGLKSVARRLEAARDDGLPTGLVAASALDTFIDGVLIGAAFAVEPALGVLLALGLGTELSALMLSVSSEFMRGRCSRLRTIAYTSGISAMLVLGGALGVVLMADRSPATHVLVLAFAASALIYLVTEELLARGRDARDTVGTAGAFFTGFILLAAYAAWAEQ